MISKGCIIWDVPFLEAVRVYLVVHMTYQYNWKFKSLHCFTRRISDTLWNEDKTAKESLTYQHAALLSGKIPALREMGKTFSFQIYSSLLLVSSKSLHSITWARKIDWNVIPCKSS